MLKKITTTLSMALLFPVLASAYTPQKEALLVGVERYQNGDRLYGISHDIKNMKELLERRGFHVRVLFNQNATVANVVNALKSYSELSSKDTFIFYDSSHGTQVPDNSGDEHDGLDEAFVLYDVSKDINSEQGLLIDDQLDILLAHIPAKKLMISDACHSGSIYKSFNRKAMVKSVHVSKNFKYKNKEIASLRKVEPKNLVVFGASADNEVSIATSYGSLFTEAFSNALKTNPNITFEEMKRTTTLEIKNACRAGSNLRPYHPTLYTTDNNTSFLNSPMKEFLQVNIQINPTKYLVEEYLDGLMANGQVGELGLNAKDFYNKGEHIKFNINTLGKQGHLYILSSKESENEIDVLYPNPYYQNRNEIWRGQFPFPSSLKPFAFKADNKTKGLERTVVYVILSQSIIPELEVSRYVGYNHFQSIFKDFNGQTSLKNAFKDILIKRKANQISIAKKVFSVGV